MNMQEKSRFHGVAPFEIETGLTKILAVKIIHKFAIGCVNLQG